MICPSCQKDIADNSRFCYLCGARLIAQAPQRVAGPGPLRLYRSATDRKIGGVCGGLAEYFEVDPAILRVLFALGLFTGLGVFAYLVAWIVIPLGPDSDSAAHPDSRRRLFRSATDKKIGGVCGGLANYLGLDATIVRAVWLLLLICGGLGFFAYLLFWFVLPLEDYPSADYASAGTPAR